MNERLQETLNYVRNIAQIQPFDEEKYRKACEYLVDHSSELPCQVFIEIPGGLSGNQNTDWDNVRAGSTERCDCGNERVIIPSNPRTEYEPSTSGKIVVNGQEGIYLKPIGGDKASTYFKLWIQDGALAFMPGPFAPLVFSMDLFVTKGYKLDMLAELLPTEPEPPIMITTVGKHKIPVFAINSVDLESESVTLTPDANVENFNPDDHPHHHEH